ncbi:methyl-accepting chemotaxis protein [Sulfuriflexus mobilis]|uniref:methyl-accepting chemotaxis protein n=1 Tax=Sulfuriflexus mobilis TaxID=1811807 RepID=UPI000F8309DD|nr:methyl-accepting chemotaxis protein [Sulfuriflexus mobilis]
MSLRAKITIGAIIVTLLVSITQIATSLLSQGHIENMFADATITGKSVLWKKIIASQMEKMIPGTSALARDRATRKALLNKDTVALKEGATTTFNLLSASNVISRMQIVGLEGEVMFSAPGSFQGKTKKLLVTQAIQEGKIVRGLERDDDGRLMAVVAFPLTMRGKPIGVGVFARNLQDAIEDFKINDYSEIIIVSEAGDSEYSTTPDYLAKLNIELPALGKSSLQRVNMDKTIDAVSILPIIDNNGIALAHLISAKDYTEQYTARQSTNMLAYGLTAAIVIIALTGLYFYMRYMLKPLNAVVSNLNKIAAGNLTDDIEVTSNDEIGQLQYAMHQTTVQLRDIIQLINIISGRLGTSSNEMVSITQTTQSSIQEQQSGIAQVATAMNEMSATVIEVARNAHSAAEAAHNADNEANNGQTVVNATISSIQQLVNEVENASDVINEVRSDSDAIGTILDVIRGIAEQTNLLALNAAIEAARAGEQGRGFAVVADEVRTLASRTQESTNEIQGMIEKLQSGIRNAVTTMEQSRERAGQTVEQASKADQSLQTITSSVSTINDMNTQIASAAEQQTGVAEEINRNVVEINHISESNAEGANQILAASENLNRLTDELNSVVHRFQISE